MKIRLIIVTSTLIMLTACGNTATETPEIDTPTEEATGPGLDPAPVAPAPPPAPVVPELTMSQEQAVGSATSYLEYSAFSRSGLIGQLEFEGFSTADATFAVDHITVDWNEQAAKSAKSYLEFSNFSRSGLIDQLVFEGFTTEQATYGVDQVGL
jgi:hypothetical protein